MAVDDKASGSSGDRAQLDCCSGRRHHHLANQQLSAGPLLVNVVAEAAVRHRAQAAAPAGQVHRVAEIAVDDQLVAPLRVGAVGAPCGQVVAVAPVHPQVVVVEAVHAGDVEHVLRRQLQAVVAAAGQVDALDALQPRAAAAQAAALVGDGRQVERDVRALQHQRVDAGPAVDTRELRAVATGAPCRLQRGHVGRVDHQPIIARAAHQHVGAAMAGQRVGSGTADQGLAVGAAAQAVGARGAELVNRSLDERARGAAEDHIAAAGIAAGGGVAVVRTNDQVGQTVAVDVARARHAKAAPVPSALTVDHEATCAGCHCAEVHSRSAGLPEHHIAAAGLAAGGGVATERSDDQVRQAVAIDIAGARDTKAAVVKRGFAVDDEAAGAGCDRAEVHRQAAGLAEHHIAAAGIDACGRVAMVRTDDQVSQAVAVHIAGTRHADAAFVSPALAVDDEAACAGIDRAEVYG